MSRRVVRGFSPQRFRAVRTAAGYTRSDLARRAGISIGTIRYWETGNATPGVDTLGRAVEALSISISDVVLIDENDMQLADLRVLAGLLQPELAARAGLATSTLVDLESGALRMQPHHTTALAHALGLTADEVTAAYSRTRNRPDD